MNFQYNYNLSGSDRKPLVEAISQILSQPAVYQGAPSFSYIIGDYTVDRNGVLSYGSNIHPDYAAVLINDLQERGFVAEKVAADNPTEEPATDETMEILEEEMPGTVTNIDTDGEDTTNESYPEEVTLAENLADTLPDADTPDKLTIEIPSAGFTPEARANLEKIVASKATLLKQALGTDDLQIVECDGKIAFPWFTLHGLDGEADAYSRLITAICNMAKRQKRVTAVEKPIDNAKFTMRLFLIRLGFIGDEYKTARKILLKNLTGNSSWKSGHKPERLVENTVTSESIEPNAVLATNEPEESPENKGGEDYGK